ncbi:unnamed protein product [Phyllotreta striolata]|uniref:Uncharacterized protein n=1 Tax=Phyllotreta striolata TaxID=444603 RepID=A0A9N9XNL6_PHYSR|nr:unnamed protein product [Phyllotreta striolata]
MNIFHLTFILTLFLVLPDRRESCPCLPSSIYMGNFLIFNNLTESKNGTPLAISNIINQLQLHKTISDQKEQNNQATKPITSTATSTPKSKLVSTISTIPPTKESATQSTILSTIPSSLPSTPVFSTQTIIPSTMQSIEPVLLESPNSIYQDLINELFDKNATKQLPLPLTIQTVLPSTTQSMFPLTSSETITSINSPKRPEETSLPFYEGLLKELFDKNPTKEPPSPSIPPLSTETAVPTTNPSEVGLISKPEESSQSFIKGTLLGLFNPNTTNQPPTTQSTTQSVVGLINKPEESPQSFIEGMLSGLFNPNTTNQPPKIQSTTQSVLGLLNKPEGSSQSYYKDIMTGMFNPNTTKQPLTTQSTTQSMASFVSPEDTLLSVISPVNTLLSNIPTAMPQESPKSFFSDLFNQLVDPVVTKPPSLDLEISWDEPSQSDSNFNSNPTTNEYMNNPMQFDQEFSNNPQIALPFNPNYNNQYPISDPLDYPAPNNQYSSYYEFPQVYPEIMPPEYP